MSKSMEITRPCSRCGKAVRVFAKVPDNYDPDDRYNRQVYRYLEIYDGGSRPYRPSLSCTVLCCADCLPSMLAEIEAEKKSIEDERRIAEAKQKEYQARVAAREERERAERAKIIAARFIRFFMPDGSVKEFTGNILGVQASYGWVNVTLTEGQTFCAYRVTFETNCGIDRYISGQNGRATR